MKIRYVGSPFDHSGYGEASRNHILAFDAAGIDLIVAAIHYTVDFSDFGEFGKKIGTMTRDHGDYKINLLHTTPDQFVQYAQKDKYNIGFCYWETDKLPDEFIEGLKHVQEIWTGSEENKRIIQASGVKKDVYVFPQAIDVTLSKPEAYRVSEFKGYMFYSIFEWTERKNPEALLEAYWSEFKPDEKVALVIKTYHKNFHEEHRRMIYRNIRDLKTRLRISKTPKTYLYLDLMDKDEILRLHATGDCFISTHRGEGWGIPQVEAALFGNTVISTGYNGCHEYFDDQSMVLLPYDMVDVRNMDTFNHFYKRGQKWANVSIENIKKAMRSTYNTKHHNIGKKAQQIVKNLFNPQTVGGLMKQRLESIEQTLL